MLCYKLDVLTLKRTAPIYMSKWNIKEMQKNYWQLVLTTGPAEKWFQEEIKNLRSNKAGRIETIYSCNI